MAAQRTERRHRLASVRGPVRHPFVPIVLVAKRPTSTANVNGAVKRKGGLQARVIPQPAVRAIELAPLSSYVDYWAWGTDLAGRRQAPVAPGSVVLHVGALLP